MLLEALRVWLLLVDGERSDHVLLLPLGERERIASAP
jgi:hypothetical protein